MGAPPARVNPKIRKPHAAPHMPIMYGEKGGYDDHDIRAMKALSLGGASDDQQRRAFDLIIHLCGTYDLSFRPGADGARLTDFAEGKRFVGTEIIKLVNFPPALMKGRDTEQG